jgi:hypothetical protein
MTTLLNLFYTMPIAIGAFVAVITLVVMFAPWDKIFRYCTLIPLIGIICLVLWVEYIAVSFAKWMRKPAAWEDDLPDLFI